MARIDLILDAAQRDPALMGELQQRLSSDHRMQGLTAGSERASQVAEQIAVETFDDYAAKQAPARGLRSVEDSATREINRPSPSITSEYQGSRGTAARRELAPMQAMGNAAWRRVGEDTAGPTRGALVEQKMGFLDVLKSGVGFRESPEGLLFGALTGKGLPEHWKDGSEFTFWGSVLKELQSFAVPSTFLSFGVGGKIASKGVAVVGKKAAAKSLAKTVAGKATLERAARAGTKKQVKKSMQKAVTRELMEGGTFKRRLAAQGAKQAGAFGLHGMVSEGAVQVASGDFDAKGLLRAGGVSAATGAVALGPISAAAAGPATSLAKKILAKNKYTQYVAESLAFGATGAAFEGRLPTTEDLAHSFAFLGVLRVQNAALAKALSKRPARRTSAERQAVEDAEASGELQQIRERAQEFLRKPGKAIIKRAEKIAKKPEPQKLIVQELDGKIKATRAAASGETPKGVRDLLAKVPDEILMEEIDRGKQSDVRRRILREEFDRRLEGEPEPDFSDVSLAKIAETSKRRLRAEQAGKGKKHTVNYSGLQPGDRVVTQAGDARVVKIRPKEALAITDSGESVRIFPGERTQRYAKPVEAIEAVERDVPASEEAVVKALTEPQTPKEIIARDEFIASELIETKPNKTAQAELAPERKWSRDWWTEGFQNSLIQLNRLEQATKGKTKARPAKVAELYADRAGHRVGVAMREFEDILRPAMEKGVKPTELGDYMHAKYVSEYEALTKGRGSKLDAPAGMSQAKANEIMAAASPEIKKAAQQVRRYVDETRDIMLEGQLITKEQAKDWKQNRPNYVQLMRDFETGEVISSTGSGFSAAAGVKKAKGSERQALPILAQITAARARAIDSAEKGRVGREFLKTVEDTGIEGFRVEAPTTDFFIDANGEYMPRDASKLMKNRDNVLSVPVNGETVRIVIDPKREGVIRAMKGLGVERSIPVIRHLTNFQRYVSTTGNLEFLLTNPVRDIQEAGIHLAEKGRGVQAATMKGIPGALKGIVEHQRGKTSEWSKYREEMLSEGAGFAWTPREADPLKAAAKMEKMVLQIEKAGTPAERMRSTVKAIGKGVESMNEVVEGGVRLSAYRALREAGASKRNAALFAKNMTLNFSKKGRFGGLIGSAYMFFNVGVQGPARMAQFAKKNPKKFAAITSSLAMAGYLEAAYNNSVSPDEWEKRSDWERDNFWTMMIPGSDRAIALRVPYGYNTFKAIGATAFDIQNGRLNGGEATSRVFSTMVDGFSPIQGRTAAEFFSPSALDPIVQIGQNKNFFGVPIKPEQPPYGPRVPNSSLYFSSVRPFTRRLAQGLNKATGGNEVLSGWFDASPEVMDYLFDFVGGGVTKVAGRTAATLENLVKGEDVDPNQIPLARQFTRVSRQGFERDAAYYMIEESARRVFSDAETAKFERYILKAFEIGDLKGGAKQLRKLLRAFYKNQITAKESKGGYSPGKRVARGPVRRRQTTRGLTGPAMREQVIRELQ